MSRESSPVSIAPPSGRASSSSWLYARALWSAVSITTMWLAVLFVGIFGGDLISTSSAGTFTKIPVVIFMLPFVLPATIAVARRGFTASVADGQVARQQETPALERPTAEPGPPQARSAA